MLDIPAPPPELAAIPPPPMMELQLPYHALNIVCRVLGADRERRYYVLHGCARWIIGGCLIIVPTVERLITERDQAAVREHETGHCKDPDYRHR